MFRAPARYTLLTSLGLVLLAGRGLDLGRSIAPRRFWVGLVLAVAFGGWPAAWSSGLARDADYRAGLGGGTIAARFVGDGAGLGAGAGGDHRLAAGAGRRVGAGRLAAIELGVLFFVGPVGWGWSVRLPESSPVLRRLAEHEHVGLVAGRLLDMPVCAGLTTAFPMMGITPPPPNYLLEPATRPPGETSEADRRWQRRFGVTHGIWSPDDDVRGTEVLDVIPDPVLDRVMAGMPRLHARGPWTLVRDPGRVPRGVGGAPSPRGGRLGRALHRPSRSRDRPDEAWFLAEDGAPRLPDPAARTADRAELGRPHGDRRARRLVRLDPAPDLLSRLVLPDRRRSRASGAQGRRRAARCPARRVGDRAASRSPIARPGCARAATSRSPRSASPSWSCAGRGS